MGVLQSHYFLAHLLVDDCHMPPARSQSAWVV
jgi:hypothetical protein